jgi:hypothetical protein
MNSTSNVPLRLFSIYPKYHCRVGDRAEWLNTSLVLPSPRVPLPAWPKCKRIKKWKKRKISGVNHLKLIVA